MRTQQATTTVRIDGSTRELLRAVVAKTGPMSMQGRRANHILTSGQRHMDRREYVKFGRLLGLS